MSKIRKKVALNKRNKDWEKERNTLGKIRSSSESKQWKKSVFEKDRNKCVLCGSTEKLEADHIVPLSFLYQEITKAGVPFKNYFDVENGRTLCKVCHKKTHTYGSRAIKTPERILFTCLYKWWEQRGKEGDFETFYRQQVEKLIDAVKERLT